MGIKNPKAWPKAWAVFAITGVALTLFALPHARGELVFDNEPKPAGAVSEQVVSPSREALMSQKVASMTEQPVAPMQAQRVDIAVGSAAVSNECPPGMDPSTCRLNGKLQKTTEKIQNAVNNAIGSAVEKMGDDLTNRINTPADANPSVQHAAPVQTVAVSPNVQPVPARDSLATSAAMPMEAASTAEAKEPKSDRATISISPRGGISSMRNDAGYEVAPRYSVGVGIGFGVSDQVSIEGGYTFSEYGIRVASSNPYVMGYQAWAYNSGYSANPQTVAMKQNVGDIGLKLYFLGSDSKVRPFLGGGGAYSKSYVNYDGKVLEMLRNQGLTSLASDYEFSQYLGYLSTGLDIKIAKSVSVGALFKYYTVLSSNENQQINNWALAGGNPYGYGSYYNTTDADKRLVGGSLQNAGFWSILGGVTFTF